VLRGAIGGHSSAVRKPSGSWPGGKRDEKQVHAPARGESLRRTTGWFALYATACVLLFLEPLHELFRLSLSSDAYSHIFVVPLIGAALLYAERSTIFRDLDGAPKRNVRVLVALAISGVAAAYFWNSASASSSLVLSVLGFLTLLGMGFVWLYGSHTFRSALFPLFFFLLMLPPPAAWIDGITMWLQEWSAEVTAWIFQLTGTPAFRRGLIFDLPGVSIEVARECSGIRSSIALGITCLAGSYLLLRRGWARAALLLAVVPIAILKNGIRIATLSLLAIHVDESFLFGRLHRDGGVVFFGVGLALLLCVVRWLQQIERRRLVPGAPSPQA
jgi:exosortase